MSASMDQQLWQRCIDFHGHQCGGLVIGYKAAVYARELLDLPFSHDEETVCVAENDACGVDAVQVILGCSAGKGNLLFHLRGKYAFSFYNRATGRALRLSLRPKDRDMDDEEYLAYYKAMDPKDMFDVSESVIPLPEDARIFDSFPCEGCGELTAENMLRLQGGRRLCLDCCAHYDRFRV